MLLSVHVLTLETGVKQSMPHGEVHRGIQSIVSTALLNTHISRYRHQRSLVSLLLPFSDVYPNTHTSRHRH